MVKKLLLAGALLLSGVSVSLAQTLHYGVKAGLTLGNANGNGMKSSFSPGFQGGVFLEKDFARQWGIQPELLYSYINSKRGDDFMTYYVNSGYSGAKSSVKLNYVSLPVLLRYNVNNVLTINLGPQFSYLFFADEDLLKGGDEAFKKTDLGIAGGLQANVNNVRFFARYIQGLTDVNNIDDRYKWHTRQIQLGLAVVIK